MTISTTILDPTALKARLTALITHIQAQVATMTAAIAAVAIKTTTSPTGIKGWVKQILFLEKQVVKILRIIGMIEVIIAEIAALPAAAVIIVIQQLLTAIAALETQIMAEVRRRIGEVLDVGADASGLKSLLADAKDGIKFAQQSLKEHQSIMSQIQGGIRA